MIPEPSQYKPLNVNQDRSERDFFQAGPSKGEEFAQELFASLNQHAFETQHLSEIQLIARIKYFDDDCIKVHAFCQKMINGEITSEGQSLAEMSTPLLQIAAHLEKVEKFHSSKEVGDVLNHLRSEINEIQQVIQIKSYLDFMKKLHQEMQNQEMPPIETIMQPLTGWHFQNLNSENNIDPIASHWRLDSLGNITLAALYSLSSGQANPSSNRD
jgi:hypothetical protein